MQQYLNLMRHVLDHGVAKRDRTGTGTLSVFGYQMRFDLGEASGRTGAGAVSSDPSRGESTSGGGGFPLLTTKKLHMRSIIHELLWFLRGETNVRYLRQHDVTIWDEWADEEGELGPIYGYQWRSWPANSTASGRGRPPDPGDPHIDQISRVVEMIRTDPDSRRLIVSAWNVGQLNQMALAPCHLLFQFYVTEGRLSCQLYQRSADIFIGVPFNIASYALLTMMVAQVTGLEPGDFIHTFGDAHLYQNHLEQVRLQLARQPRPLPVMKITPGVRSIFDFRYEDFSLERYDPHPHIVAPVAV